MTTLSRLFSSGDVLLGVVHLAPLPGSPGAEPLEATIDRARRDLESWFEGGADGVVVENFGDRPFHPDRVPPATVAAMGRVLGELLPRASGPVGVNVLRNDAEAALALAAAHDLAFVRVNVHAGTVVADQGLITGQAHRTLRLRQQLPGEPLILADVAVKHARPLAPRPLEEEAQDLFHRGRADALLVTGPATGSPPVTEDLERVRRAVPDAPLLVASGVNPELIRATRGRVTGWIVGTWAKEGGNTTQAVAPDRVRELAAARR